VRPLRDRERHHRVDSNRRKQKRDYRKGAKQNRDEDNGTRQNSSKHETRLTHGLS